MGLDDGADGINGKAPTFHAGVGGCCGVDTAMVGSAIIIRIVSLYRRGKQPSIFKVISAIITAIMVCVNNLGSVLILNQQHTSLVLHSNNPTYPNN